MRIVVADLEMTDFKSDIGSLRVACFAELNSNGDIQKIETRDILDFNGEERGLERWIVKKIKQSDILIGHNIDGYDRTWMRGAAERADHHMLPKRFYIDTMQVAQYGLKGRLSSYSLENVGKFFKLSIEKDHPTIEDWRLCNDKIPRGVKRIRKRCVIDVQLNVLVWNKLKPYWFEWRGK